tara:strand:+ start:2392 stop:2574 length:183 start_codon:yes stop_codon:yes gene_type:complete
MSKETVEEFLARGGKIKKVPYGEVKYEESIPKNKPNVMGRISNGQKTGNRIIKIRKVKYK